ncbi:MAG: class I SAM-dependent methyltransferase [Sumerlaeia bacterium]
MKEQPSHWTDQYFSPIYNRVYSGPLMSEANTEDEVAYLERAFQSVLPEPIIDVGCAFGRHVKALKKKKWPIVGLDRFRHLLADHPKRGRVLVCGDMRLFPFLPGSLGGLYCLFNSFGYYPHEDNMASLLEWASALKPGGRLVLQIPNRPVMAKVARDFAPSQMMQHDFTMIESYGYDSADKSMTGSGIWKFKNEEQVWSFKLRMYTRAELERAMNKVGLVVVDCTEDFVGTAFDPADSPQMVLLCEKSGANP